jgi:hypothetical protein
MEIPERATGSGTVTTNRRRVMNGGLLLDDERQTEP